MLTVFADYADLKSPWYTRALARGRSPREGGRRGGGLAARGRGAGRPGRTRPSPRRDRRLDRDLEQGGAAERDGARAGASGPVPHRADPVPATAVGRASAPWRRCATSAWTGRATRAAWSARRCHEPPGCSLRRTPTRRWPRTGPDGLRSAPDERRTACLAEVRAGRLDEAAVESVLAAAGHRVRRRRTLVAGLTTREADVLALLVRGCPTGRSPSGWSSRRAPSARTSSTSSPRPGCPPVAPRSCSRCATAWSTRGTKHQSIARCDQQRSGLRHLA